MIKKVILVLTLLLTGCINQLSQPPAQPAPQVSPEPLKVLPAQATVPILIYHHVKLATDQDSANDQAFIVSPENFETQMAYLSERGFVPISFANLLDYFAGEFVLPNRPVIISFDDGVINQYENAWPVLKSYNFTATFFIFPNPIGKSKNYMTWEQLQELVGAGMEIGSHGWYHLYFDRINQPELEQELVNSKQVLEEKLGINVKIIAYPFGEYNENIQQAVKTAGYQAARDILNGKLHTPDTLYQLRSYFVTNDFSRFTSILK